MERQVKQLLKSPVLWKDDWTPETRAAFLEGIQSLTGFVQFFIYVLSPICTYLLIWQFNDMCVRRKRPTSLVRMVFG